MLLELYFFVCFLFFNPKTCMWKRFTDNCSRSANFFFFFWTHLTAREILVPRPGIEPGPSAVKARGPNHWTSRNSDRTLDQVLIPGHSLFSRKNKSK